MALLQPGSREWAGSREAPPSENSRMLYWGGAPSVQTQEPIEDGSHSDMEVTQDQTSSPLSEGIKHIPSTAILCSAQPHGCPSLDFLPVCPQTQSRVCLVPEKEGDHRKKLCFILALESTTRLD